MQISGRQLAGNYREIPEDKILKFRATPGFKGWKRFFTEDSVTHPAKMNLNLLRWVLSKYTAPGDLVLDPMAGTGSTVIIASLLGRHGVAIECESQFCKMINENIKRTSVQSSLMSKGSMTCYHGDARKLSELLEESDVIVTSPPYSGAELDGRNQADRAKRLVEAGYQPEKYLGGKARSTMLKPYKRPDHIVSSPPYGNRLSDVAVHDGDPSRMGYKQTVDAVLTSPPFSESKTETGGEKGKRGGDSRRRVKKDYQDVSEQNIGSLSHGEIDKIITSPPYGGRTEHKPGYDYHRRDEERGHRAYRSHRDGYFSDDPNQIGNLSHGEIDNIVTSPPYEDSKPFRDIDFMKNIVHDQNVKARKEEASHHRTDEAELKYLDKINGVEYEQPDNIGTLKGETYLSEMLQVYRECFKVLNTNGKMMLVVKNFIRDQKVVRLDLETIKLCEAVGFKLIDQWYFKLPTRSFWKILYHRKYPDLPKIEYEDVLIFQKVVK